MPTVKSCWSFDAEDLTDGGPAGNSSPTSTANLDYVTGFVGGGAGLAMTNAPPGESFARFEPLTTPFASSVSAACWVYVPTGLGNLHQPFGIKSGANVDLLTLLVSDADPVTETSVGAHSQSLDVTINGNLMLDAWNFVAAGIIGANAGLFICANDPSAEGGYAEAVGSIDAAAREHLEIAYYNGVMLDDLTIFSGTLIEEDLIWLYNAGAGRTATEILAHTFSPDPGGQDSLSLMRRGLRRYP